MCIYINYDGIREIIMFAQVNLLTFL